MKPDGPCIAMTFDDGPEGIHTPRLLDFAAQRRIRLTFFVLGIKVAREPDIARRIVAEGHEIGNHSWSHANFTEISQETVRDELQKTDSAILQKAGIKTRLMRPPYGSITEAQCAWIKKEFGYRIVSWNVDPRDWKDRDPEVVAHRILGDARAGSIILCHDIHASTIDAMPGVFDHLLRRGFKFATVSELLDGHPGAFVKSVT